MTIDHYYDITDRIPVKLSNPQNQQTYYQTGVAYDISIGGQPFFLLNDDNNPYRNVTAAYRKQQIDQTREPGEQTLTGWWLRSQSSFHLGQGITYFEPAQDESLRFQYTESKGVDVWTKGQATLILDTDATHTVTAQLNPNLRPNQFLRSIQWAQNSNTYYGCLMLDGYDIDKIYPTITATVTNKALTSNVATLTTSTAHGLAVGMEIDVTGVDSTFNGTYTIASVPTTTTLTYAKTASNVASTPSTGTITSNVQHFVDYNAGIDDKVYAYCDDGIYAYWLTNVTSGGTTKLTMYKKPLTGYAGDSPTTTVKMFDVTGTTISNGVMEFTKERIVACINNKVYEIAPNATSLPTAVYTHPVDDFVYTSITSSGAAIYVTGFSGTQSNIQKFTLTTAGAMPTLTSAITAAEMPSGERIYKIAYYLGYMMIGTTKGVRVAAVSDTDGSLAYGPLIWENGQPVYDFAFRDSFAWAATGVDGEPGTIRINLASQVTPLVFAYAYDTYNASGNTSHQTTACAFIDGTDRLAFTSTATATANGSVYIESATRLVESGYIQTGYVRYNTLENKIFKYVVPRFNTTFGSLTVSSIDQNGTEYGLGSYAEGTTITQVGIAYPTGAQQYVGFKFTFHRYSQDITKGPKFTGYQLKVLPAVPRQYLIQYPCSLFDSESDKFGNKAGYEGAAANRLSAIQQIESAGDTVKIEDFRTGEVYTGIIEETDFINKTPTDKRYSGFGGLLLITIRTIS